MIVKIFDIPFKSIKIKLPSSIQRHINKYEDKIAKKDSYFCWCKLGEYVDLTKVKFTEYGKPYLIGNRKYISLSHSGAKGAIAISNKPVGIDIQELIPKMLSISLAQRFLNKDELKKYFAAKDREVWFTKYWTQHEAYIKLQGYKLTFENLSQPIKCKVESRKISKSPSLIYVYSIATKKRA